jgi:hypothetical protein
MTEEYVSGSLYRQATADPAIQVLSWQSVDGKGYFAADIKLRLLDQRRFEPDLIIHLDQRLWLIEVKGKHSEAVSDEIKLAELLGTLGEQEVLRQVRVRAGTDVSNSELVLAVAYYGDDLNEASQDESPIEEPGPFPRCVDGVLHIDWETIETEVADGSLSTTLRVLYAVQQSST